MFNPKSIIDGFISTTLGQPILENELTTRDQDNIIDLACYQYYKTVPLQIPYQVTATDGTVYIHIDRMTAELYPTNTSEYNFLGIIRSDYILAGEDIPGSFNAVLAGVKGVNVGSNPAISAGYIDHLTGTNNLFDPSATIAHKTTRDYLLADETIHIDKNTNRISITTPTQGHVQLFTAFNYSGSEYIEEDSDGNMLEEPIRERNPWDLIRNDHLELVADFSCELILKTIISARSALSIPGDTDFDNAFLITLYTDLVEKNRESLLEHATPIAFYA